MIAHHASSEACIHCPAPQNPIFLLANPQTVVTYYFGSSNKCGKADTTVKGTRQRCLGLGGCAISALWRCLIRTPRSASSSQAICRPCIPCKEFIPHCTGIKIAILESIRKAPKHDSLKLHMVLPSGSCSFCIFLGNGPSRNTS